MSDGQTEAAQAVDRRFLCERCGGTGQQQAGLWNQETKQYNATAGVCDLCHGDGYLGEMPGKLPLTEKEDYNTPFLSETGKQLAAAREEIERLKAVNMRLKEASKHYRMALGVIGGHLELAKRWIDDELENTNG